MESKHYEKERDVANTLLSFTSNETTREKQACIHTFKLKNFHARAFVTLKVREWNVSNYDVDIPQNLEKAFEFVNDKVDNRIKCMTSDQYATWIMNLKEEVLLNHFHSH